ncbi:RNA polymerase subunit sigma-24 [Longimonas halophila]|uniref:RNA polymerase subunit sigma-24 n=1 Tax=Longimonas halophila TaxID=1469170 RepID=A0A2H3NUB8_9BACT|nr:RNA polymerase subunit sigma-24 [Longimonas halophila]
MWASACAVLQATARAPVSSATAFPDTVPPDVSPNATDEALIAAVQAGDTGAFRYLVERYESVVAATVIGMLGPGPQADDVGQETMIRLYRSLDQFEGAARLKTYVTRIAINVSIDALRARKRRQNRLQSRDAERPPDEPVGHANRTVERREQKRLVQQAVRQLDTPYRAVVVLRLLDGYSTQETADILEIPYGTVLSRLHRAKKRLADRLRPLLDADRP